jgi:predicted ribosome quality control (RQC) complex YloA/Tae2 family protein
MIPPRNSRFLPALKTGIPPFWKIPVFYRHWKGNFRSIASLGFWNYLKFFRRKKSLESVPQQKINKIFNAISKWIKQRKHTKRPAQVVTRIRTRYTAETSSLTRFLGTIEDLLLSYRAENGTVRCRIEFCIQHNTLERQHNSLGESGQDILLKQPHLLVFGNYWGLIV